MKTKKEKIDVYEMINNMILEKLQQGTLPWKKTWNSFGPARNYVTNKPYRGFNALILGMIGANFDYPLFMTFNQAKQLGGFVKKGSKGFCQRHAFAPVVFWKKLHYSEEISSILLSHNHPSGNLNPSQQDILLTRKIKEAGRFLELPVVDHIIVTTEGYYSFADEGLM